MGTSLRRQRLWSPSALRNCGLLQDVEDGDHPPKGRESGAMDGAMHPRSAFDKRWDSWRRNSFDVLKELISAVSRSRALLRDGDHPPKGRKFGAMFLFASEEAIPSTDAMARMLLCHSASREVGRLELWMNRMLTEGKLSLTTGACRNSKLVVERGMLLVLEQWEIIWKCFSFPGHGLFELIFPFAHEETYFRGIAASLSEEIGSFLDMFTPPTEAEEGLLRKNRDEDLLRKKRDEEARLLSAFADLALLYLYLVGLIDRGGTRTYSSGSLLYSSTFVSIVLVLAFYVWFKSRAAPRRGCYSRPGQSKIEARYYPPIESGSKDNLYLGLCATEEDAEIKHDIAANCYGKHPDHVVLVVENRQYRYSIPPMPSQLDNLSTKEKRENVVKHVKKVFEDVKNFRLGMAGNGISEHHLPQFSDALDQNISLEGMDLDFFDNPEAMPDVLDAGTQLFGGNHVLEAAITVLGMADNLGDGRFDHEPAGPWTSWVSPHDIPQSNLCEVPPTLSARRESPTSFELQYYSPMAGHSNLDQPKNTSLDVVQQLVESVSWLVQQNGEKDRRLAEHETRFADYDRQLAEQGRRFADNARLNEELARVVTELKRDNERLRSISQF